MVSVSGAAASYTGNLGAVYNQLATAGVSGGAGSGLSAGSTNTGASGIASHGPVQFSGQTASGTDNVAATQSAQGSGVTLHFADGSSVNVVGATHINPNFFGH